MPEGISWSTIVDDYNSGLNVDIGKVSDEIDSKKISKAYFTVIKPQVGIALDRGFEEWE